MGVSCTPDHLAEQLGKVARGRHRASRRTPCVSALLLRGCGHAHPQNTITRQFPLRTLPGMWAHNGEGRPSTIDAVRHFPYQTDMRRLNHRCRHPGLHRSSTGRRLSRADFQNTALQAVRHIGPLLIPRGHHVSADSYEVRHGAPRRGQIRPGSPSEKGQCVRDAAGARRRVTRALLPNARGQGQTPQGRIERPLCPVGSQGDTSGLGCAGPG